MLRPSIAVAAMFMSACLGAASGDLTAQGQRPGAAAPTQFDYLVLASLADSQQLLSMAAYRPNP
jgi:hypothetical protein